MFEIPKFLLKDFFQTNSNGNMAESLNMIAQRNTLGIVEYTVTPYALKGQHIVENKYIALSGRNFLTHFPTQRDTLGYRIFPQRDALGYHIFGFQPKTLYLKMLHKSRLALFRPRCVSD